MSERRGDDGKWEAGQEEPPDSEVLPDSRPNRPGGRSFGYGLKGTLAAAGCFQVYWSEQILDEATRNLCDGEIMTARQAERLRTMMEQAFPEAMVRGHERLIPAMRNREEDRHVSAAAVKAEGHR